MQLLVPSSWVFGLSPGEYFVHRMRFHNWQNKLLQGTFNKSMILTEAIMRFETVVFGIKNFVVETVNLAGDLFLQENCDGRNFKSSNQFCGIQKPLLFRNLVVLFETKINTLLEGEICRSICL